MTKIAFYKGHLMAFKAKTQGTTSGQLFEPIKTAFLRFWPGRPLNADFGYHNFVSIFTLGAPAARPPTVGSNGKIQGNAVSIFN